MICILVFVFKDKTQVALKIFPLPFIILFGQQMLFLILYHTVLLLNNLLHLSPVVIEAVSISLYV